MKSCGIFPLLLFFEIEKGSDKHLRNKLILHKPVKSKVSELKVIRNSNFIDCNRHLELDIKFNKEDLIYNIFVGG